MREPNDSPHDGKTPAGVNPEASRRPTDGEDVSLLEQLAEFSQSAGEYGSALEYYEQILHIAEKARESSGILAQVLLKMAICRSQTGDYAGALEILDQAVANLPENAQSLDLHRILNERAFALIRIGEYAEAEKCVRRVTEEILDPDAAGQLARAQNSAGVIAMRRGDWDAAQRALEAALAGFRVIGDRERMAQCLNNLGLMERNRGNVDAALRHLQAALKIAEEVGDTYYVGVYLNNIGLLEFRVGRWEQAREHWERALRLLEGIGNKWEVANVLLNLGNYYRHKRDWEEADAHYVRAQKIADDLGEARERVLVLEYRGDLALSSESYAEARRFYREGLKDAMELAPAGDLVLELYSRLADLESRTGHLAEAKEFLKRGLDVSGSLSEEIERAILLRIAARLEALEGDFAAARDVYRKAIESQEKWGAPFQLALTRLEYATFCIENLIDLDAASDQLERARVLFEKVGADYEAGHAYLMMAKLEMACDHPSPDARHHLETAIDLLESVGSDDDQEKLRIVNQDIDRLLEETSLSERNDLAVLNEIVGRLQAARDAAERVAAIEHALRVRMGPARVALLLVSPEGTAFTLAEGSALPEEDLPGVLDIVAALRGEMPFGAKPLVSTSPARDPRFADFASEEISRYGSVAFMPLFSEEELLGGLYVDRRSSAGYFHQPELDFLVAFATAAAMAVQEMRLEAVRTENVRLRRALASRKGFHGIITQNRRMLEILDLIERLRDSTTTVLIQGETGTGKELVARALHAASSRSDRSLVTVNCAALSRDLLESELFGHIKGAFTDAKANKIGLFEKADGGTIFLDEIDKTTREFQERLLRVVDQGEVKPVGSNQVKKINVRILVASNRPLKDEVADGRFLPDLFYRLRVISIDIPPLRQRKEDVPLLVAHFLDHYAARTSRKVAGFTHEAMNRLVAHSWPGNVRDLQNEVERAIAMTEPGNLIDVTDLSSEIAGEEEGTDLKLSSGRSLQEMIENIERQMVTRALQKTDGNRSHAAKLLGLSRRGLLNKIARYSIDL